MSRFLDGMLIAGGAVVVAMVLATDTRREWDPATAAATDAVPLDVAAAGGAAARPLALRPYLGKPTPPIRVRAVPAGELHSGRPGRVRIEVTASGRIENLRINIYSDQDLVVLSSSRLEIGRLARGEYHSAEIEVTPTSGGVRRLAALVEFEVDGERQAMPVALAVPVAGPVTAIPAESKPERRPVQDATGEWVYPLPAD